MIEITKDQAEDILDLLRQHEELCHETSHGTLTMEMIWLREYLETKDVKYRILNFKQSRGLNVDPDHVELFYKDGRFNFFEVDCHQKIQEVFPRYGV